MFLRRFARLRSDEAATDPILVIAAIAVSLILLVGGSFAVAGMISNGRNLNAKGDLSRVATAEAAAQTNAGTYLAWSVTASGSISGDTDPSSGVTLDKESIGFTPTPGDTIKVNVDSKGWVAGVLSTTGTTFWASNQTSTIFTNTIPASAYDAGLTPPTLGPPYNAVGDCQPTSDSSAGAVFAGNDGFTSRNATATGASTLTYTLQGTGQSFCVWAKDYGLNLGGDTFTMNPSGTNMLDCSLTDPPYDATPTIGNATVTLQANSGTSISAQRTMTVALTFSNLQGYTTAQLASYANSNGLQLVIARSGEPNGVNYTWHPAS
ncbi:hypothetical protein [Curtobacterium sp. MCBD17_040]|uniref:hypothetical protein n=1 Tax=Curtobacterium sp. MCBD17_040 TaxID=2175674 RepID=UPI000DA8AF8D|nr:hypothetical protein [Curtobacterium sp. MCBD17_040]WIB65666.1 hypothetical protein DEI94_16225 [Curtobacterium sp. MCBD17_040]